MKPQFENSYTFTSKDIIALILGALSIWLSYKSNDDSTQAVHELNWDQQQVVTFRLDQLERWVEEIREDHQRAAEQP